jgi:hypothetical protein
MGEGAQLAIVLLAVLASAGYLLRGWWRSRCLRTGVSAKDASCGGCSGCGPTMPKGTTHTRRD